MFATLQLFLILIKLLATRVTPSGTPNATRGLLWCPLNKFDEIVATVYLNYTTYHLNHVYKMIVIMNRFYHVMTKVVIFLVVVLYRWINLTGKESYFGMDMVLLRVCM